MHVQTHLMSGWCVANVLPLNARERLLCMVAAVAPDVDGISRVFGEEAYWDYHHVVGHNLAFALALSAVLAVVSARRLFASTAFVLLVHLHLVMDYFGSGPGWGIPYLWPVDKHVYATSHGWAFYSWQNLSAAAAFLVWTLWVVDRKKRTPLEAVMPSLDRQLVDAWERNVRRRARLPSAAEAGPTGPPA